jgi:hypothetical protein
MSIYKGLFPAGLRSPRVSGCGVRIVRFTENPCSVLPSGKNPHLWIGHLNVSSPIKYEHYFRINAVKRRVFIPLH